MEKRNDNNIQKKTMIDNCNYNIGNTKYIKKEKREINQDKDDSKLSVKEEYHLDEDED